MLIHLSLTPSVRVQVLLLSTFYKGDQSTERMNKLAHMVKQGFKPRQSRSRIHAPKDNIMLPLIII